MTIQIAREEARCRHMGYSFRLAAWILLYAKSHRQDSTYHGSMLLSKPISTITVMESLARSVDAYCSVMESLARSLSMSIAVSWRHLPGLCRCLLQCHGVTCQVSVDVYCSVMAPLVRSLSMPIAVSWSHLPCLCRCLLQCHGVTCHVSVDVYCSVTESRAMSLSMPIALSWSHVPCLCRCLLLCHGVTCQVSVGVYCSVMESLARSLSMPIAVSWSHVPCLCRCLLLCHGVTCQVSVGVYCSVMESLARSLSMSIAVSWIHVLMSLSMSIVAPWFKWLIYSRLLFYCLFLSPRVYVDIPACFQLSIDPARIKTHFSRLINPSSREGADHRYPANTASVDRRSTAIEIMPGIDLNTVIAKHIFHLRGRHSGK